MRLLFFLVLSIVSNSTLAQEESLGESAFDDGVFNLIIGDPEEAKKNFTIAIAEGHEVAKSFYYRSKAHCGQRGFDKGLSDINQSLKLEPNDHLSLDMRGRILVILDRPAEALEDFEKVFVIDSTFENLRHYMGRAHFKLEQFEQAIAHANQAILDDPEDGDNYRLKGLSYLRLKKDDEACNNLSKARKLGGSGLDDLINKYCGEVEIS